MPASTSTVVQRKREIEMKLGLIYNPIGTNQERKLLSNHNGNTEGEGDGSHESLRSDSLPLSSGSSTSSASAASPSQNDHRFFDDGKGGGGDHFRVRRNLVSLFLRHIHILTGENPISSYSSSSMMSTLKCLPVKKNNNRKLSNHHVSHQVLRWGHAGNNFDCFHKDAQSLTPYTSKYQP